MKIVEQYESVAFAIRDIISIEFLFPIPLIAVVLNARLPGTLPRLNTSASAARINFFINLGEIFEISS